MRITRTSKQAQAEIHKKNEAFKEVIRCPECGKTTPIFNISIIQCGLKNKWIAECEKCGCQWESSEF